LNPAEITKLTDRYGLTDSWDDYAHIEFLFMNAVVDQTDIAEKINICGKPGEAVAGNINKLLMP
jgi:hypothetical protein